MILESTSFSSFLSIFFQEFIATVLVIALILTRLISPSKNHQSLPWIIVIITISSIIVQYSISLKDDIYLLGYNFHINKSIYFIKYLLSISLVLSLGMDLISKKYRSNEYYIVFLSILIGLYLLTMVNSVLSLIVSIEMSSICTYILVNFSFRKQSHLSSLRYILLGAIASALMIYGLSLMYGQNGVLLFSQEVLDNSSSKISFLALFLTLCGVMFKMAIPPFHIWVPYIYEHTINSLTAFISFAPKAACIPIIAKLIQTEPIAGVYLLGFLIISSLIIGNFSALQQKTPKKLIAYSSIAQVPFFLMPLLKVNPDFSFSIFYLAAYMIGTYVVFSTIDYFENKTDISTLKKTAGLSNNYLVECIFLTIGFLSLAGMPFTGGFIAKLFILIDMWKIYASYDNILILIIWIISIISIPISLFYYLKMPYFTIFKTQDLASKIVGESSFNNYRIYSGLLILALLFMFINSGMIVNFLS